MNDQSPYDLKVLADHFDSGATRSYAYRLQQLQQFRATLLQHERQLQEALYADLKKSPEESWVTETGFVLAEINHTIRHLKRWMKPKQVRTNLLNLPSKSYIYKEPLGVVLIIAPWNYPFQLLMAPLVGALAAGNCVVLKP
ncbi:MAG TPA: aldehyde dehydrogenase family protein, partial [Flavisolibacter sp.]|nr:aldehyde dehydrogenase family protein [Flavisolibacter sp.]